MITCSRRIQFCSGHRVLGHEGKCANPHGHNYVAWFHARAPELDSIGRVIDFSVLKERIGGWIDKNWDHAFLVGGLDETLIKALGPFGRMEVVPFNPTAEEMAKWLLEYICPEVLKGTDVVVYRIELYETENCRAEATLR